VAPIFGTAPLYIKKDKKWQMPLIMRPVLLPSLKQSAYVMSKALGRKNMKHPKNVRAS
jgi:hypothetical protein